jgi:hypothetical protein
MIFAAGFDACLIPFYGFAGLMAGLQYKTIVTNIVQPLFWSEWDTLLAVGKPVMNILTGTAFLCAVLSGGLHLISFALSIYLAVTFRKILKLPPDMNPLEDNLTSRHKRNKSSMSVSTMSEKRTSMTLEGKRSSGAPYEDLSRPPSIPFLHTRQNSTESFSTYHSTPPATRDARVDLPSRQYQIQTNSARSSIIDLKRSSVNYNAAPPSPPKRGSYTEIPLSDSSPKRSSRRQTPMNMPEAWYTAETLSKPPTSGRSSPRKQHQGKYQPLYQRHDSVESFYSVDSHPNPLDSNPSPARGQDNRPQRNSALSEISSNQGGKSSGDLADLGQSWDGFTLGNPFSPQGGNLKARFYGDLKPATPPIMVGGNGSPRQISSGNDYGNKGHRVVGRRDVSGKIAEEGRSGDMGTWGTRFRKISGL